MNDFTSSIWTHWHPHPEVLIGLFLLEGSYLIGIGPLRKRFGLASNVEPHHAATFTLGVLVIFLCLVSPIHILADQYLFSVHMLQHVLLTLVAPPLLIIGTPDWLLRPLLRPTAVLQIARLATNPVTAFLLFNVMFSLWHIPFLYNLSVTNHLVHIGEHLIFISTATLLWWPVTSKMSELPRLSYPLQIGYIFLISIAQLIVFATITFSKEPIYQWYVDAERIWGITPLVDQQVGAFIMKIGGGILYITLIIVLFLRWFSHEEEKAEINHQEARSHYR